MTPFKDLPEGQTHYDPKAELNARITEEYELEKRNFLVFNSASGSRFLDDEAIKAFLFKLLSDQAEMIISDIPEEIEVEPDQLDGVHRASISTAELKQQLKSRWGKEME